MLKNPLKIYFFQVVSVLLIWGSIGFSLYYGDDFLYPRLTNNLKDYYEVNYSSAYFANGSDYRLYDSFRFSYNLNDDFIWSLQKKYIPGKLTLGMMYKYFAGVDLGEIGIGIRNLGINYADMGGPYGQEYLVYTLNFTDYKFNLGIQRMINNGADFAAGIAGVQTTVMGNVDLQVYYDYPYIGAGVSFPWSDQLHLSLTGYGQVSGVPAGNYKAVELGLTILNFGKSEKGIEGESGNNKMAAEALIRLKNQERSLSIAMAKISAMEYLYSEEFQRKLIDELVAQKIIEQKLRDQETTLLKVTLQHIQKGLEYYYLHDLQKAYEEYKMANSLYPNMPLIHDSLGSIYYKLGHFEQAKQEWLLALSLDPSDADSKKQIDALKIEHAELFK